MDKYNKKIAILGSTGSVGKQSVEVAQNIGASVELLVAGANIDEIEKQARILNPKVCVLTDENAAKDLKLKLSDTSINVYSGEKSMLSAIQESDAEVAINAISGFDGLHPAIACAKSE